MLYIGSNQTIKRDMRDGANPSGITKPQQKLGLF